MAILTFMNSRPLDPFNRRGFASKYHLSPSTAYDRLKRLVAKGLVERKAMGVYLITQTGQAYAKAYNVGGRVVSGGMSARSTLSQHSNRFVLDIKDRTRFDVGSLCKLGAYEEIQMSNWSYVRLSNSDANVTINPKNVVIYVEEVVADSVEKSMLMTFDVAVKYARDLRALGLDIPTIRLENVHFARVESALSDLLVKKLGKYQLKLDDGSSFWIDFSGDKVEDETDSAKLRTRLDQFMNDLVESESSFSDLDKLREITSHLVKLQLVSLHPSLHPSQRDLNSSSASGKDSVKKD